MSQQSDSKGKNWVLIVAGSRGWFNYRHQANACHAYQIVHRNGVPDEQIVVMMYDDIAYSERNPTPGIIINRPNGPDVYKGVPKDYSGRAVTPENFLSVLRGDSHSGKVLRSGPDDHVFVYFTDHGATGVLNFPHDYLHVGDFKQAIHYMHANKKYKKMVLYIEACHSGSMLTGLPADTDVYATTSCRADQPGYACYHDSDLHTMLGDCFSVAWMENSDEVRPTKETLLQQFEIVKKRTSSEQEAQQFGDKALSHLTLMEFQGNGFAAAPPAEPMTFAGAPPAEPMTLQAVWSDDVVPVCDVPLAILKRQLMATNDMNTMRGLLAELQAHLKVRDTLKEFMLGVAERVTGDKLEAQKILDERMELSESRYESYKSAVTYYKNNCFDFNKDEYEYALTHLYALANLCESGYSVDSIQKAMDHVKAASK